MADKQKLNGDLNVTYTGHSTVLIEMDGVRLLTDPLLRPRVAHLGRLVGLPEIIDWNLDAVLISHMHWDHLDLPSLRLLGYDTPLIVPRGSGLYLQKKGFKNVEEIARYEITRVGPVSILATPAAHPGDRPLFGPSVDSLGFLIQGSQEVYFAGDTDIFPEMEVLSDNTDVALLPVWGYGPTLGTGHLDPFRAAQALPGIDPKVAVPIHWGTYCPIGMVWMQMAFLHYPPHSFQRYAQSIAPGVDIQILEPGQSFLSVDDHKGRKRPSDAKLDGWQSSKLLKWQARRYKGKSSD
jgi:L-ascorbate metabolism protein UlaG (beta-lactamase superfamily)